MPLSPDQLGSSRTRSGIASPRISNVPQVASSAVKRKHTVNPYVGPSSSKRIRRVIFSDGEGTKYESNASQPTNVVPTTKASKEVISEASQTRFVNDLFVDPEEEQVQSPLSKYKVISPRPH